MSSRMPQVGEVLAGYQIDRLIAHGGMSSVFAAHHLALSRPAAIKCLSPWLTHEPTAVARFLREARIISHVQHPNLIEVYDYVQQSSPNRVAMVMELLEGPTVAQLLDRGPLRSLDALNISLQLCEALSVVHKAGVVHRDIKPENVILMRPLDTSSNNPPRVKLIDFGVASSENTDDAILTIDGTILGTPAYMAPEQVAGDPAVAASDIYALAELLVEMLTGKALFPGHAVAILRAKSMPNPPNFTLPIDTPLRSELSYLLSRSLSPYPQQRPCLAELSVTIEHALKELHRRATAPEVEEDEEITWVEDSEADGFYEQIIADLHGDSIATQKSTPVANYAEEAETPVLQPLNLPKLKVVPAGPEHLFADRMDSFHHDFLVPPMPARLSIAQSRRRVFGAWAHWCLLVTMVMVAGAYLSQLPL